MGQAVALKMSGLYTDPNPLGTVPQGALLRAKNVVVDKQDVIESMRGFKLFGSLFTLSAGQKINNLFSYKSRLLAHYGTTMAYDSNGSGSWTNYSGSYSAPTGVNKIRSFYSNKNFYFTTDAGIKKLSSLTGTIGASGVKKALGGTATLSGVSGFLATANQLAYRIVWGRKDDNNNLILGAPSQRIIISNASGGDRNVSLTFFVPEDIASTDFYQIYRSGQSGGSSIEPNDELQLVIEKNPTSGEIAAKSVTVVDNVPDSLRGATLYTSPSQEGIGAANDQPPLAKDVAIFRECALFANTVSKHRFNFTVIGVASTSLNYFSITGDTTNGSPTVLNASSTSGLAVGQLVTGTGIPANTKITAIVGSTLTLDKNATATNAGTALTIRDRVTIAGVDYYANATEVVASNYFAVASSGVPADDIEDTAYSLISVINQSSSNTLVYAYYLSGYDDLPGQMLIEERSIGGSIFYVTSSKGSSFSPVFNSSGTTHASSNDEAKNRIYIAKERQSEAVPILNYLVAGSADEDILRMVALRDSVFIFKDDGIFRLSGLDPGSFRIDLFDNTAKIKGAETAVALNNQVFLYSDQGVIAVSDSGVAVVSRPIESDLATLSSYTYFESASFGVAYESARKFLFFTVSNTTDQVATQAYVYNSFTNAWTQWEMERNCGIVNPADDKLYLGSADTDKKYLYVERKTYTIFDYALEEWGLNIVSYSGTTVTVDSTADAVEGYSLAQGATQVAKIETVVNGTTLEMDREIAWDVGVATIYQPIANEVKWTPIHAGNPGVLKQFPEVTTFFRQANFREIQLVFTTNFIQNKQRVTISPIRTGNWGEFDWGEEDWGGGPPALQPIRTYIPLEAQRAHWINFAIEHEEALTVFALCGFSVLNNKCSARFR
jgi:hypothetical protein